MKRTHSFELFAFLLFSFVNRSCLAGSIVSKCEEPNWERDYVVEYTHPKVNNTKLAKASNLSRIDETGQANYLIGLEFDRLGSRDNTVSASVKLVIASNSTFHLDCMTKVERSTFNFQLSYSCNTINGHNYGTNQADYLFIHSSMSMDLHYSSPLVAKHLPTKDLKRPHHAVYIIPIHVLPVNFFYKEATFQ